jgi:hypothetical protein
MGRERLLQCRARGGRSVSNQVALLVIERDTANEQIAQKLFDVCLELVCFAKPMHTRFEVGHNVVHHLPKILHQ